MNVVYHSQIDDVSMICEIQLLLGQYLYEKKNIHKLYNISRQELFFKMVVEDGTQSMDELEFESILNASEDVDDPKKYFTGQYIHKCSMDTDYGILGIETRWRDASKGAFVCVDIKTKKIIFEQQLDFKDRYGRYSHHFVLIDGRKYVSFQSGTGGISLFDISFEFHQKLNYGNMSLEQNEIIIGSEWDESFEHMIILRATYEPKKYSEMSKDVRTRNHYLEKRAVKKMKKAPVKIRLEEDIVVNEYKVLTVSSDGNFAVITGGVMKPFAYFIDLQRRTQSKWTSEVLNHTTVSCLINGATKYVAVGGRGKVEICQIAKKESIKVLDIGVKQAINALYSTHNILAVASNDKKVRLYDVRNWKMFYEAKYKMLPKSLHLTKDSKYLTIGGSKGEQCIVLKIK